MSVPVIEAVDLMKILGEGAGRVQALKGVTLTISGGELVLLMGPSGCGKTTLLSVVGCMLSPTRGTVRVVGRDTHGLKPEDLAAIRRQHVGFVFQSFRLFESLSAVENVAIALEISGHKNKRQALAKADGCLGLVEMANKKHLKPAELSGGEKQRVAIARALMREPQILLADEPTASLDSKTGELIAGILREIAQEQRRTVVVVSHDQRLRSFATQVTNLRDGTVGSN